MAKYPSQSNKGGKLRGRARALANPGAAHRSANATAALQNTVPDRNKEAPVPMMKVPPGFPNPGVAAMPEHEAAHPQMGDQRRMRSL